MTEAVDQKGPHPPTSPVKKIPFLPSESLTIRRLGRVEPAGPTLYVFRDVLEELIFAATFRPALTTTGVLTGGFYEGPAGRYVEVRGFHATSVVDSTLQFAQRLRTSWSGLFRDRDLQDAGLIPIGWFVSRSGSDGRPGPFELMTHLSYFNRPYHVFCVLDPLARKLGFYRQVEDTILYNVAFNLIESAPRQQGDSDANQ